MKRTWKALLLLLGGQALLSAFAAALEWKYSCGACRAGGLSLGALGLAFYAGLLVSALFLGPTRLLYGAILFGFGIHLVLAIQLLCLGIFCALCLTATALSLTLVLLSIACDRANLVRLALVLPWAVLLVVGWTALPRPAALASASVTDTAAVRLTVFSQPDCAYCDELRHRILPEIEREFGTRLQVVWRPAGDLPGIRRTPTLVLSPGRRDRQTRIIEGLPASEALRTAIRELEARP